MYGFRNAEYQEIVHKTGYLYTQSCSILGIQLSSDAASALVKMVKELGQSSLCNVRSGCDPLYNVTVLSTVRGGSLCNH